MSSTGFDDVSESLVASWQNTYSKVSVKAVGIQIALMTGISVATVLAFSFFRPREKKVYAPKVKYSLPPPSDPADDPDYEPPPPTISNSFWAWISPIIHLKEEQTTANVGLDAATFLRFLRLLRYSFSVISLIGIALLVVNIVYNIKYVSSDKRNFLSLLTITNVRGNWVWPAIAASYLFNFIVMYFVWRNWRAMVILRHRWFRSPAYQTKIYSRTLMVTQIRKDFRSDAGLVSLMGLLKVDGIKIGPEIDCATIGRRIGDFPELVEEHNKAVADLEEYLVKYLRDGKVAPKRPTVRKGAVMGIFGGQKLDAIDYYAKQIKYLREKIDTQRHHIESLRREQKRWRKGGVDAGSRIEGENYGFVTFKTISECHRIARAHHGKQKELHGARLQLAPMPQDIVWQNMRREPAQIQSRTTFGFVVIGVVCFLNTIPLLVVSLLANLSSLTVFVPFLDKWSKAGQWGDWTFSLVSGVLPSVISFIFGYLLPIIIRRISKYQGAPTRSRLDRAVTARYFTFIIISNLLVFSLLGVFYNTITQVVLEIGKHTSVKEVFEGFKEIPYQIQSTYVIQSTYWLTWLPLRGFLVIFELVQLIKLALVSIRRYMFSHTPRDIREMTKPAYFDYPVVIVNLLFVCAIGMIYAPLAPLVAMGACIVFWFSSAVYKYQLLYVWISRAESGGRMWNVYINRLLVCCVLMQLLMILTTGLVRRRWLDTIAAAPPVILVFVFKFWIRRMYGEKFRYFEPTPQEAENERHVSINEKRTRVAEMEKRFLHPALQHDKLFKIMVHKRSEEAAREVLSAYPWFGDKYDVGFIKIKGVREDNLEYDPARDGPRDEAHQNEWDARSQASTEMLGGMTGPNTPGGEELYKQYPSPETPFTSRGMAANNMSTDYLLAQNGSDLGYAARDMGGYSAPGSEVGYFRQPLNDAADGAYGRQQRFANGVGLHSRSQESITGVPLLQNAVPTEHEASQGPYTHTPRQASGAAPYPPTAYTQPPLGYTPPGGMHRTRSGSDLSMSNDQAPTPWDSASDISESRRPSRGMNQVLPPGARTGYPDDAAPAYERHRQGSVSRQASGPYPPQSVQPGRYDSPVSYNRQSPGPNGQGHGARQASMGSMGSLGSNSPPTQDQNRRPSGPAGPRGPGQGGRYEDPYARQ